MDSIFHDSYPSMLRFITFLFTLITFCVGGFLERRHGLHPISVAFRAHVVVLMFCVLVRFQCTSRRCVEAIYTCVRMVPYEASATQGSAIWSPRLLQECFRKFFPEEYTMKLLRRLKSCLVCGEREETTKGGLCEPCTHARVCERCGAMNSNPSALACESCADQRARRGATRQRFSMWCQN